MKYILIIVCSSILTIIIMNYLKTNKGGKEFKTVDKFKKLAKTPEAKILIMSKPFKDIIKTKQFGEFAKEFGTEQLYSYLTV